MKVFKNRKSYEIYQPVYHKGRLRGGSRNCFDRYNIIGWEVDSHKVKSIIDLGCAEGFYTLQLAKQKRCLSLGVDMDIRRINVAREQATKEEILMAGFLMSNIDEKFLDTIPKFDMVIFMSVLHHFMYLHGEDYCLSFLKKLREKVGKVMIFEMGQSDETANKWAELLPDMGSNPHEWIRKFVLLAGFSKVEKIGESDSYKKDQNRAIFRAEI